MAAQQLGGFSRDWLRVVGGRTSSLTGSIFTQWDVQACSYVHHSNVLQFWRNISFNSYGQLIRWVEVGIGDMWWLLRQIMRTYKLQLRKWCWDPRIAKCKLECDQKSSCNGVFCADKKRATGKLLLIFHAMGSQRMEFAFISPPHPDIAHFSIWNVKLWEKLIRYDWTGFLFSKPNQSINIYLEG